MAEPVNPPPATSSQPIPNVPPKAGAGNPAFRMMGLPNFKFKLPSRNWMIFLSVTGTITAAVLYDKREKRRNQEKWCKLVSHLANEPLPTNQLPRKVTIYLAAPPGDGLGAAREHFREYVKPVLVAAALDYEVVESRREGDLRARLAERIRNFRRKLGEGTQETVEEDAVEESRRKAGIRDWDGIKGDVIIGRHTWKEYIRGLHEGWLGPLEAPPESPEGAGAAPSTSIEVSDASPTSTPLSDSGVTPSSDSGDESPQDPSESPTKSEEEKKEEEKEEQKKEAAKSAVTAAYISPQAYSAATLPPTIPASFEPSYAVRFPHLLGFLNTPRRIVRFFNRRQLSDDIGREAAAIALGAYRPYRETNASYSSSDLGPSDSSPTGASGNSGSTSYEQQAELAGEEAEWPKSIRKPDETGVERVWLDDIVLDPRLAARMSKFELNPVEEERARRIREGKEGVLGWTSVEQDEAST